MNYTVFTNVKAQSFKGDVVGALTGDVAGALTGGVKGATLISKSADYALSAAEKNTLFVGCTMSAASKVLTLGLAAGQVAFIHNTGGTNAFTVKNVSGDTGTALDSGKTLLMVGSASTNGSTVVALN